VRAMYWLLLDFGAVSLFPAFEQCAPAGQIQRGYKSPPHPDWQPCRGIGGKLELGSGNYQMSEYARQSPDYCVTVTVPVKPG